MFVSIFAEKKILISNKVLIKLGFSVSCGGRTRYKINIDDIKFMKQI